MVLIIIFRCLVNNVATNHSIPTPFIDETDDVLENIVHVNIWSTLKITKMVLQQMVERFDFHSRTC
jgi:17beta-estradiol 17-dehydrogenase / very-long-chain 3-oxoacyl-CoA reductase